MTEQVWGGTLTQHPTPSGGVWVAYHSDRSGVYVFPTELAALRYAVQNHMTVAFVQWGKEILAPPDSFHCDICGSNTHDALGHLGRTPKPTLPNPGRQ